MSSDEFNMLAVSFHYGRPQADAGQRVYEALSALELVGYTGSSDVGQEHTFVDAQLSMDEYQVPMTASAAGKLSFAKLELGELATKLRETSGADALYFDGELVAGTEPEFPDDVELDEPDADDADDAHEVVQVIAGAKVPRSELAMSTVGHGGGWKVKEDDHGLLAVRTGEPVDLVLDRKMVPALELQLHEDTYQLRLHARNRPINIESSVETEYWLSLDQRPVPAVAAGSPAAKLLAELGQWLYGIDEEDLAGLDRLWPEAAAGLRTLSAERTEAALREFVTGLGLPEAMVDYAKGEPVPEQFEELRGGLRRGLNLALEEEISGAKGPMKLVYRTGWSPQALIISSVAVLGAGALLNRWMVRKGKPGTGWRRTIMFFWYSDAAFYLGRGIQGALRNERPKA